MGSFRVVKLLRAYWLHVSLILVSLFSAHTLAEQKVSLANWDVHYIALNTTFLTPKVAKQYGIVRSKFNGLINISVLDKTTQKPQSLLLSGEAKNLLGTVKKLSFKKVTEGKGL